MDAPPDIPPRLDVRILKSYDQRAVTDLWSRRTGLALESSLELVFDDESAAPFTARRMSPQCRYFNTGTII